LSELLAQAGCNKLKNDDLCKGLPRIKKAYADFGALLNQSAKNSKKIATDETFSTFCPTYFDMKFSQHMMEKEKETGRESACNKATGFEYTSTITPGC
jgi:hypothetical protein